LPAEVCTVEIKLSLAELMVGIEKNREKRYAVVG
jgi:hypothetical protein